MSKTVTPARYRLFHDHANQVGKATLKPLSAVSEVVKPANSLFMITTAGPIDLIGCESTPGSDGYMYPITEAIENGKVDWVRNASSYNLTKATLIGPASMRLRHSHGTLLLMDPPTFKYPRRFILRYRSDCDPEPSPFKRAFLSKMCAVSRCNSIDNTFGEDCNSHKSFCLLYPEPQQASVRFKEEQCFVQDFSKLRTYPNVSFAFGSLLA